MKAITESQSRMVWLICLAGFALILLNAIKVIPVISDLFQAGDGDDQMRLVQVRDWMAGQGWFDMHQYRVLPPDGIAMHWSRYLDAGISSVLVMAGWVLSPERAELATLIIWPAILACAMVLVHGHGSSRLFGPAAALGALAVFFSWSKLGGEYVAPRIDHHGIQILCGTAVFYLSLVVGRPRILGALAGAATAFSLSIGLELLPFYATLWGVMALRHAFDEDGTGDWLIGFGVAISIAAPVLLAGQTPRSDWGIPHCDVLALPVLVLGAIGVVATLVPVLGARVLSGPTSRIVAMLLVSGLGLWLSQDLLGRCMAGPYSQVPPVIRDAIEASITEALPASVLARDFPGILGRVLLPPLVILVFAAVVAWRTWSGLSAHQRIALGQAFLVSAIGFCFALYQIRAANLMTPAIPLLAGFLVSAFVKVPRTSRLRIPALLALCLALPATLERGVNYFLEPLNLMPASSVASDGTKKPRLSCRNAPAMAEVASLPTSLLFNPVNLGASILVSTNHSVASASYHRSPEALWNGLGAFQSVDALRDALAKSNADFLVFCVGGLDDGEKMLLRSLKTDTRPDWLVPDQGDRKLIAVYRIDKAALQAATGAP